MKELVSNSLECSINFSTSEVIGTSISSEDRLEQDINKIVKND
jgi:hypothetical protein